MRYLAHRNDPREQLLSTHLLAVAERARASADWFNAGEFARVVALHHDLGKYSANFQKRIRGSSVRVDHSTAGAQHLYERNPSPLGLIAAYCIAGHHGGLPDGGSKSQPQSGGLYGRLGKVIEDFSAYEIDLDGESSTLLPPSIDIQDGFQASFFTRMVFSCLVDADWLDTEQFMSGQLPRGAFVSLDDLWELVKVKIESFQNPTAYLNKLRTEILNNCLDASVWPVGLYTLTAPTGSGKTISSMAFALKHAITKGHRRIIYVVPYNTIIEQNAEVFEKILGSENVIQHHSGISYPNDEQAPQYYKLLATENWDAPIIVTSSVQFFESLFSNRPASCRKLHNIAGSVIIFDEAQMIPLPYLIPCVEAIKELVNNYSCTAVLATATQSSLDTYFRPLEIEEIVARPEEMYEAFKRVRFDRSLGELSEDELIDRLSSHEQVLCIVNTRRRAQALANNLEAAFHLSTTMYPQHRRQVLTEIRHCLQKDLPCLVISTSLIEAGVDIDFPVVYRERAGLDSIIQAAGRCNRENKNNIEDSVVYIFEYKDKKRGSITPNAAAYEHVARLADDISSLEAITMYFQQLRYTLGDDALDINKAVHAFNDGLGKALSLPFDQVAKTFHLIEENTKPVYVLFSEPQLAARLRAGERNRELFRMLQPFTVSLYEREIRELAHLFERIDEEILLLTAEDFYNKKMGVELTEKGGFGLFY